MHMSDGGGMRSSNLVPPEWRKKSAGPRPAGALGFRQPAMDEVGMQMSPEDVQRRWSQLMNKKGHGDLTPDEQHEADELEARMRRMRGTKSMDAAA